MKVRIEEHKVPKKTEFGTVQRSLNQSIVYVQAEDQPERQAGYYSHVSKRFLPLVNFPMELADEVCSQIAAEVGNPVASVNAPKSVDPVQDEPEFVED